MTITTWVINLAPIGVFFLIGGQVILILRSQVETFELETFNLKGLRTLSTDSETISD